MYRVTCDGFPLLDWRDNDLFLVEPKVNLEVNTVGEGSFTIYKDHPNFDKLARMKSIIEVSDETSVIFRGRATNDTVDFDHGTLVDVEGVMAFFNDSVVRPFNFPDDFAEDSDYLTAEASGERVAFLLGWLIDNHNAQVQDFQKLKLGNVTVTDAELVRTVETYASTWEVIKAKFFESTLGGYLCIRYEKDGNYIDYLSEFTETNSQEIAYGENLLDLTNATDAAGVYSAIIPIGALGLTIEGKADGNLTDDIVKSGDTLYSKKAVERCGWIYAPMSSTTWDEVVDDADLLQEGVNWLAKGGSYLNSIEASAVDLHFTDAQVESLRIYKNVAVVSEPHGLAESFPLSRLEIDLLNPQNTKITVGKTAATWTEQAAQLQDEVKKNYSRLSKTDEQIKLEVFNALEGYSTTTQTAEAITAVVGDLGKDEDGNPYTVASRFTQTAESISAAVEGLVDGEQVNSSIEAALDGIELSIENDDTGTSASIKLLYTKKTTDEGGNESSTAIDIAAGNINLTGLVTISSLANGETTIDGGCIKTDSLTSNALHLTGLLTVYSGEYTLGDWVYDEEIGDFVQSKIENVGGFLGYDSGYYGKADGIGIRSANEYSQLVCTNVAARLSYTDDDAHITQVVCGQNLALSSVVSIQFSISGDVSNVVASLEEDAFYPYTTDYQTAPTLGKSGYGWKDIYAAGTSFAELVARVDALEKA